MEIAFAPDEIAGLVGPSERRGGTTETIRGIASLHAARPGDLSFLGNRKYRPRVSESLASVILVPPDYPGTPRVNQLLLAVENPSVALGRICLRLEQALWPKPAPGVHPTAAIAPGASVAASATIGPLCVVEAGAVIGARTHLQAQVFVGRAARIGEDCWLMPGTTVAAECELRNRVRLQPGAVVGSDGFGYEFVQGRHEKLPQVGGVVVGDDVEIGANATIDRGRFSNTTIGEGSKIDNLVQIAHNVAIGRHCLVVAQTGISGSTTLEDYVVLAGQIGTVGHVTIGRGARVGAQSGIDRDVPPGASVYGTPFLPIQLEHRLTILKRRLPELFKRVDALESGLEPGAQP